MARPSRPWFWEAKGAWYCTVRGRRHRLAAGKANRAEAEKSFHRLMLAEDAPEEKARAITAAEVCDLFLEAAQARLASGTLAPPTVEFYARHLQAFCDRCGGLAAAGVKPLHVSRWLADSGWGRSTQHGAITAVKAAFRWAFRQGYLEAQPLEHLERPGIERREAVLTPEQFDVILGATKDAAWRDVLEALWHTGARPGEVAKVTAAEVNPERGAWVFPPRRSKTGRKTGRARVVYLDARALEITRRRAAGQAEGPIFRNLKGNPWTRNAMACRFARIRKKFGYGGEATAYALRHRWITRGLEAGVPIATVAELAGHSDTTMVSRVYSHLHEADSHLREAAKKVTGGETG